MSGQGWATLCGFWLLACCGTAAAIEPPRDVTVKDRPNDAGQGLIVAWTLSVDDPALTEYVVFREVDGKKEDAAVARVPAGTARFEDSNCRSDQSYRYLVQAVGAMDAKSIEAASAEMKPVIQWFDRSRFWLAIILTFVCGAVIVCTELAKRGYSTYVRPLAGLTAIDEAVGRATEMGRPILYIPGIMDLDQVETVAGLTILAHVGEKAAIYDTPIEAPSARSLVMTAAREALAGAYLAAGRPDSFDEERVYYITDDQFSYVASVCGWMSREKPAACFYLGKFFAESLVLAETGNAVGAIQLAGTAEPAQLPFFVAACDYTLIGEELFAASAYLSGEPQQLGTLKGQDIGKVLAGALLVAGCLLATLAVFTEPGSAVHRAQAVLMETILKSGGG